MFRIFLFIFVGCCNRKKGVFLWVSGHPFSHVQMLWLFSLQQSSIKLTHELLQRAQHLQWQMITVSISFARSKWNKLEVFPSEVYGRVQESLWMELVWFLPESWISVDRPSIDDYCNSTMRLIAIYFSILGWFSRDQQGMGGCSLWASLITAFKYFIWSKSFSSTCDFPLVILAWP